MTPIGKCKGAFNLTIAAVLLFALSACNGDGDSSSSSSSATTTGTFVDGPVEGLGWRTSSGMSGKTGAGGTFQFMQGDTVTFFLGDPIPAGGRQIGAGVQPVLLANGTGLVTSLHIFGTNNKADHRVVNLARLLLSLHNGAAPTPGGTIVIPLQLPAGLPAALPNLDVPPATFNTVGPVPVNVPAATATTHLNGSFSTVSVTIAGAGSGTVSSTPAGITNCTTSTCSSTFANGNAVTLTATGAGFAGWNQGTGSATGCDNSLAFTCTFSPTSDSSITATFNVPPAPPNITILPNQGSGTGTVTCSANGGSPTPCAASYASGAALVIQAAANAGSTFTTWANGTGNATGCTTNTSCSFTLNTNTAVRPTFVLNVQSFTISTSTFSANGGGGTIGCSTTGGAPFTTPCATSFNAGTSLTLQATPDANSNFLGWGSGSGSGAGTPSACNGTTGLCTFTVTGNASITANFKRPTLSVVVVGTGTVNSNPAGINNCSASCSADFNKGVQVVLTASGTGFTGWSGGGCAGVGTCQLMLTQDLTATANYSASSLSCPVEPALVKDINPDQADSNVDGLTNVSGTLFFSATDGVHGNELWKSDGTTAGTVLVKDILVRDSVTGSIDSNPRSLTNVNGTLFFTAFDGDPGAWNLWKSDGTESGTVLMKPVVEVSAVSLIDVNGTLFFTGQEVEHGSELWKSDGTAGGTVLVKDIRSGAADSGIRGLTNVNGTLFFSAVYSTAQGSVGSWELWKSDGTTAGTVLVKDIVPGPASSQPLNLTNVNGTLFFSANDGNGPGLWKSDGTEGGTVLVKRINAVDQFVNVNGKLFFKLNDPVAGLELGISDGTESGTRLVKDILPGLQSPSLNELTNVNGTLFFTANGGNELWKSDGTEGGTVKLKTIFAQALTDVNGTLFFSGNGSGVGWELWRSDGTELGTTLVKDILPGSGGSNPLHLTNVNGTLFFEADTFGLVPDQGRELWSVCGIR